MPLLHRRAGLGTSVAWRVGHGSALLGWSPVAGPSAAAEVASVRPTLDREPRRRP